MHSPSSFLNSQFKNLEISNIGKWNITNAKYFNWRSLQEKFPNKVKGFQVHKLLEVVLLDNPCCMRVGGLSRGLSIDDGNPTTLKNRVLLFVTYIFATRTMYDVNFNKKDCVN